MEMLLAAQRTFGTTDLLFFARAEGSCCPSSAKATLTPSSEDEGAFVEPRSK